MIAVTIAALGIATTLITLLLERRRETAVLRFLGATRRQIRRIVVLEAALLAAVSQAIGIAVGLVLSLVLIFVVNMQSFAWTIRFELPVAYLIGSTAFGLLATAVAGLYPAARAARVESVKFVSEE